MKDGGDEEEDAGRSEGGDDRGELGREIFSRACVVCTAIRLWQTMSADICTQTVGELKRPGVN